MLKLTLNGKKEMTMIPGDQPGHGMIDDKDFRADILSDGNRHLHMIIDDQSVNVEILALDRAKKAVKLSVNGHIHDVVVQDRFDMLLHELGMEAKVEKELRDIKAPMPGLVIDVLAQAGQEVEKDSPIIILEAMKMENIIKSPTKGIIKHIAVTKGQAVEKNEVLVAFE